MKHVFFVHSAITYLVSKEIISQEKIDIKNCVLLSTQDYFEKLPYKESEVGKVFIIDIYKLQKIKNPILREHQINKYISSNIKEKYLFYTPHDLFLPAKYFIFHPLCSKYFYIEEGMASYNKHLWGNFKKVKKAIYYLHEVSPFFNNFLKKSFFNLKLNWIFLQTKAYKHNPKFLFNHSKHLAGAYTFSEKGFPFPIKKMVLDCPTIKKNTGFDEGIRILIFDNMINSNLCRLDTLLKITREIIEKCTILYIKFHPAQKEYERAELQNIFKKSDTKITILPDQFILEELFIDRSFIVYGFFSSLLYYNQLFSGGKGKSISLINNIIEYENRNYEEKYLDLIAFFKNNNIKFK